MGSLWQGYLGGRTVRCAKSRLFSITGCHGSQGPEFCTLQHQGFFIFSLMLATDPKVRILHPMDIWEGKSPKGAWSVCAVQIHPFPPSASSTKEGKG